MHTFRIFVLGLVAGGVGVGIGCGSSDSGPTLDTDGGSSGASSGSNGSSGSSGDDGSSGAMVSSSGVGASSGVSSSSGLSGSSGTGSSGAGSSSGTGSSSSGSSGATSSSSSSSGGATRQIVCGAPGRDGGPAATCNPMTDVCCVTTGARGTTTACSTAAMCTGAGKEALTCTGTSSCSSGDVCCLGRAEGGPQMSTSCEASCPVGATQLCESNADCGGAMCTRAVGAAYGTCARTFIRDAGGRG